MKPSSSQRRRSYVVVGSRGAREFLTGFGEFELFVTGASTSEPVDPVGDSVLVWPRDEYAL